MIELPILLSSMLPWPRMHTMSSVFSLRLLALSLLLLPLGYSQSKTFTWTDIQQECRMLCPLQEAVDTGSTNLSCNASCQMEYCSRGCSVWHEALHSSCVQFCDEPDAQLNSTQGLYCLLGCNYGITTYAERVKNIIGIPHAPTVEYNSSVVFRWDNQAYRHLNITHLIQWRYASKDLPMEWKYVTNVSVPSSANNYVLKNLKPFTKYKFRLAMVISPERSPVFSAETSTIITKEGGAPEPVQRLSLIAMDSRRVSVNWNPPLFPHAPLLAYVIKLVELPLGYTAVKEIAAADSTGSYLFGQLKPNTTYSVSVAARNKYGEGDAVTAQVVTTAELKSHSDRHAYLLTSRQNQIFKLSLDILDVTEVLFNHSTTITGMAVQVREDVLFIADADNTVIEISLSTRQYKTTVISPSQLVDHKIQALRVDWLYNHMYILLEGKCGLQRLNAWCIARCSLTGNDFKFLPILLRQRPAGFEVDPYNGYLFWNTKGPSGGIFRSDLDPRSGSAVNDKKIYSSPDLEAFVVDYANMRLLVSDVRQHTILSMTLNALEVTDIRANAQNPKFEDVSSLVVYNDLFFWASGHDLYTEEYENSQNKYFHNLYTFPHPLEPFTTLLLVHADGQPVPIPSTPVGKLQALFGVSDAKIYWQPPLLPGDRSAWNAWKYEIVIMDEKRGSQIYMRELSTTEVELRNLRPNTDYAIRVRALSMEGYGPWVENPFCGSTLPNAASPPKLLWASTDGLIESSPTGHDVSLVTHKVALQGILNEPFHCTSLAWMDDLIYMTMNNSKLMMINTTSRHVSLVGKVEASCVAVDFLGKRLYWSSPRSQLIIRGLLNGSNPESLPLLAMAKQIEIDSLKGKLFWSTGHSVEGALLNGIDKRLYWTTGLFSGKRVMGIAVTQDNLFWAVRSSEETVIYRSSTEAFGEVIFVSKLDSIFRGPMQVFSKKLIWLQEDDSTALSDLNGKNMSVLNSVNILGSTCFLAKDHSSREFQHKLRVIPSAVKENSIKVYGNTTEISVTWDNTTHHNYGDITYDVRLSIDSRELPVATSSNTITIPSDFDVSPYSLISVSIKASTVWGSASVTTAEIRSPSSTPSVPLKPRAFVSHRKLPFQPPETFIKFRWDPPARPNGVINSYKVYWKDDSDHASVLPGNVTEFLLEEAAPNSSYSFSVEAYTDKGNGPRTNPVQASAQTEFPVPKLLLITMDALWLMDVDRNLGNDNAASYAFPGKVPHPPIAVTYINHEDTLFWIDEMQEIFSKLLSRRNRTKLRQLQGYGNSLTADWVGRNLYWSEINGNQSSINRLDLNKVNDENSPEMLIKSELPLKVIEIEPFTSRLIYTESLRSGTTRLMVASIDGSNPRKLFSRSGRTLRRRRSVNKCNCPENPAVKAVGAIDRSTPQRPRLLWVDYYTSDIWSSDLEGCHCQLEVNATLYGRSGFPPSSLASDASNIYWTNTTEGRVYSLPRGNFSSNRRGSKSGALKEVMQSTAVDGLREIKLLGEHLQPYPSEECLIPAAAKYVGTIAEVTESSITVLLPPPERPNQCQSTSLATVMYTVYYGTHNASCRTGEECFQLKKETFEPSVTLPNLRPYTKYTIRVALSNYYSKLRKELIMGEAMTVLTKPGAPSAPRDVQVLVTTPISVQVRWMSPSNLNGPNVSYEVHWRSESLIEGVRPKGEKRSTGNHVIMPLLANIGNFMPGHEYQFWVRALAVSGGYNESTAIKVRLFSTPNGLRQLQSSSTSLVLTWEPHPEIRQFHLEYKSQYANHWMKGSTEQVGTKEVRFVMRDLEPKSTYIARLNLVYSTNQTFVWPAEDIFAFETQGDVPGPPTKPVVMEKRRGLYQVTWETPKLNGYAVTDYQLQAKLTEGESNWTTVYNGTENSWVILGLENHEKYSFRVRALNEKGWSSYSSDSVEYQLADLIQHPHDYDNFVNLLMWVSLLTVSCVIVPTLICCITRRCRRPGKKAPPITLPLPDVELQALPRAELSPLRELPATLVSSANALYLSGHGVEDVVALPHVGKDNITLTKFLGSGAFGEVFEGLARGITPDGQELRVAVKTLRKGATDQEKAEFLKEAELMSHFKHDHILRLLGVCLETDPNFLLLELMEGGDLLSFLRANRPNAHNPCSLTLLNLVTMCVDVAKGCQYLEELHFVHRDLAARNCLVSFNDNRNRVVKIGDFGLARDIYRNDYYRKEGEGLLPVRWMAPESLVDGVFTSQSDVWSFGVLLWEIMTLGQQPYPARTNLQVLHFVRSGGRLDRPPSCPDALHQLMLQCWSYCAEERPSFQYCLEQLTLLEDLLRSQPLTAVNNGYYVSGLSSRKFSGMEGSNLMECHDIDTLACSHEPVDTVSLADACALQGSDVDGNHNSLTESQSRSQSVRYLELVSDDGYEIPNDKSQEGDSGVHGEKILPCSLRLWRNDEDMESITTDESTVPNSPVRVEN